MTRRRTLAASVGLAVIVALSGLGHAGPIEDPGGILYHLDATLGVTKDGSDNVSLWADQGLAGNDFLQGDAARQPQWMGSSINGLPAIQFDGSDEELLLSTSTQPRTFIAVTRVLTGGGLRGIWGLENGDKGIRLHSTTHYRGPGQGSDGNDFANGDLFGVRVNGAITTAYTVGDPHIIAEVRGPAHSASTYSVTSIGEYFGTRDYHGDVAELLVYDHILDPAEIVAIENLLGAKYGIATAGELPPPPPPPATPAFNARMIRITGGGGSNDNDINNTTEALSIANAATGLGTLTIGPKIYNVNVFVDEIAGVIDYAGGGGHFSVNNPYPNGSSSPGDDFLVRAQAYVRIPAGTWSIAFGSDDGGMLSLDGITFTSTYGENAHNGVGTDEIRFEGTRGHGATWGTFTVSEQTYADLFSLFFERGSGDSYEISIAPGAQSSFSPLNFRLLQNQLDGWIVAHSPIPEPGTLILAAMGLAGLRSYRRRRRTA